MINQILLIDPPGEAGAIEEVRREPVVQTDQTSQCRPSSIACLGSAAGIIIGDLNRSQTQQACDQPASCRLYQPLQPIRSIRILFITTLTISTLVINISILVIKRTPKASSSPAPLLTQALQPSPAVEQHSGIQAQIVIETNRVGDG